VPPVSHRKPTTRTRLAKAGATVPPAREAQRIKAQPIKPHPARRRDGETGAVLLAGGNPRIAKAEGDAPVQAYIAALPGAKCRLARRLDALIVRTVPDVRKAVKWNSPLYGIAGQGWFLGLHAFAHYLKVSFFRGTALAPVPPGGTGKDARWIDLRDAAALDEAQMARWVKQAAALPGFLAPRP
jgi:hypothetical protein